MDFWHKQLADKPLFADLLWSRPQNRLLAGKLLIIGGNVYGFNAPAMAYKVAEQTGAGAIKVLLPDALRQTVGKVLDQGEFAPSTPSGSFSRLALAEWLDWSAWADATLLAGDLGRNSETAVAVEQFARQTTTCLIITKDAVDCFQAAPQVVLEREQTVLVLTIAQLQKLATQASWPQPLTFSMGLLRLVDWLHQFSAHFPVGLVLCHHNIFFVAVTGQVSTTPATPGDIWRVPTAAQAAVWYLQNPSRPFQALTTGILPIEKL